MKFRIYALILQTDEVSTEPLYVTTTVDPMREEIGPYDLTEDPEDEGIASDSIEDVAHRMNYLIREFEMVYLHDPWFTTPATILEEYANGYWIKVEHQEFLGNLDEIKKI